MLIILYGFIYIVSQSKKKNLKLIFMTKQLENNKTTEILCKKSFSF